MCNICFSNGIQSQTSHLQGIWCYCYCCCFIYGHFLGKHGHLCRHFLMQSVSFRSDDFLNIFVCSSFGEVKVDRSMQLQFFLFYCVFRSEQGRKFSTECDGIRNMFTQTKYNNGVWQVSPSSGSQPTGMPHAVAYLFRFPLQSSESTVYSYLKFTITTFPCGRRESCAWWKVSQTQDVSLWVKVCLVCDSLAKMSNIWAPFHHLVKDYRSK